MMNKVVRLYKKNKKEIPIFFATDDNYIPYLDVALRSLIANASRKYNYVINILNTGIKEENKNSICSLQDDNFKIIFRDISDKVDFIKNKLRNVYHFSMVTWYRLFIQSLFPEYDKVLYLDCDIIILEDISKLYNVYLGNNLLGAARCHIVSDDEVFGEYAEKFCGVPRQNYLQAGVLVMNLKEFRKRDIENKFAYLINKYNFDVIDPDQGYLNAMCNGSVKILPNGWNKEAIPAPLEGKLNIVHYALYKKPWQYDDVLNQEYFWQYAKTSPFYEKILESKANFSDEMKSKKEKANIEIFEHAKRCINSDKSFVKLVVNNNKDWLNCLEVAESFA